MDRRCMRKSNERSSQGRRETAYRGRFLADPYHVAGILRDRTHVLHTIEHHAVSSARSLDQSIVAPPPRPPRAKEREGARLARQASGTEMVNRGVGEGPSTRQHISVENRIAAFGHIATHSINKHNSAAAEGRIAEQLAAEKKQRQALIAKFNQDGFEQVMEEVAYTWFNRFTALRFMEVNNYLPSHTRVFSRRYTFRHAAQCIQNMIQFLPFP